MPHKAGQTCSLCGTDVQRKEGTHKENLGIRTTQSAPDLQPLWKSLAAGKKEEERTHKENYLGVPHKAGPTCNFSEKDDAQTPPHPPLPPPPTPTSDPHRPTYHNPRLAAFVEAICSEKQIAHKSAPRHTACCGTDE